jgi:hypothetical protein
VDLDTALADPRVANLATILNRSQQLPKRK